MRPCRPIAGLDRHRDAAAHWLERLGVPAERDRILITNGAAQGIFLAVAAVVRPGDLVLTENLTDHGIIGLSNVLGFTLRGLPTDAEGILPEAFEAAVPGRRGHGPGADPDASTIRPAMSWAPNAAGRSRTWPAGMASS